MGFGYCGACATRTRTKSDERSREVGAPPARRAEGQTDMSGMPRSRVTLVLVILVVLVIVMWLLSR